MSNPEAPRPSRFRATRQRIAAALITTAVTAAIAWGVLRGRFEDSGTVTVEVIDQSEAFTALLESRHVERDEELPARELRELLIDEEARELLRTTFYKGREGFVTDPLLFYRREAHIDRWQKNREYPGGRHRVRTNDLGMRNDEDVLADKPDLRIIVTGDSHTEGVCGNSDSFTYLLGEMLREQYPERSVEALNAGTGGYNTYHYLGVLQRYVELEPDVFIAVVFGGNDWKTTAKLQRYFLRDRPPTRKPFLIEQLQEQGLGGQGLEPQELGQLVYFLNNPRDVDRAIAATDAISQEMQRICTEEGIELVCVYLPAPIRAQPRFYPERVATLERMFAADGSARLGVTDTMADRWTGFMEAEGIRYLDLRDVFHAADERLYWIADSHINLKGNHAVARALFPIVRDALESRRH